MSSDNAQSTVTYTSISSNSDGPSWGIPLMNVDPMELDEHAPVYVPEPQHLEYQAPPDDGIQVEDDDDDPKEDPEEDPSEEHKPEDDDEDPEEDPNEEHESKGSEETEPFEEDEIAALIDAFASGSSPFPLPPTSPAYDQAQLGHRATMIHMRDDILEEDMPPRRRFELTDSPPVALQASERRMMTSIEEVNLRVSYQMMRIHTLEARARVDTVEDADSNC
nr:hypothetical protein [Tanacetum cinerariifolium]